MSDTGRQRVIVIGMGEIGRPLYELVAEFHDATAVDIEPVGLEKTCDVLHMCIPFEIGDFEGECVRYIEQYAPAITVINSTVAVGTTRSIQSRVSSGVVNSPVRGKHASMKEDLLRYTKYIGALESPAAELASTHFQSLGMKTRVVSTPETSELAKLSETTYFGLLIAWAQQMERFCLATDTDYDEAVSFYDEIGFFPQAKYFPGVIRGHCVMSNIKIIEQVQRGMLLDAICESNAQKTADDGVEAPRG